MPFYKPDFKRKIAAVGRDIERLAPICHADYKAECDALKTTVPRYRSMTCEAGLTLDFHWTDCARTNLINLVQAHRALFCIDSDQSLEIMYPGGSEPLEVNKLDTGATLLAKAETVASSFARYAAENPDARIFQI